MARIWRTFGSVMLIGIARDECNKKDESKQKADAQFLLIMSVISSNVGNIQET